MSRFYERFVVWNVTFVKNIKGMDEVAQKWSCPTRESRLFLWKTYELLLRSLHSKDWPPTCHCSSCSESSSFWWIASISCWPSRSRSSLSFSSSLRVSDSLSPTRKEAWLGSEHIFYRSQGPEKRGRIVGTTLQTWSWAMDTKFSKTSENFFVSARLPCFATDGQHFRTQCCGHNVYSSCRDLQPTQWGIWKERKVRENERKEQS